MGYSTSFFGHFDLDKALTKDQAKYLHAFAESRRMRRDADITQKYKDPLREAVGLPIGAHAEYFVGSLLMDGKGECSGQHHSPDIVSYNEPPSNQPSLWCQWIPTVDRKGLTWNGDEKFYEYGAWLEYIIENFLKVWGLVLSGRVEWEGDDSNDRGVIHVRKNVVKLMPSSIIHGDPEWEDNVVDNAEPDLAPNPIDSVVDDFLNEGSDEED